MASSCPAGLCHVIPCGQPWCAFPRARSSGSRFCTISLGSSARMALTSAVAGRQAVGLSVSTREALQVTYRSGTQRARGLPVGRFPCSGPPRAGSVANVSANRPWWQLMRTSRQAFVFGGFWTVIGLGQLLVGLSVQGHIVNVVIGAIQLLLAIGYLASAVAQRRRERSGAASHTGQPGFPPAYASGQWVGRATWT